MEPLNEKHMIQSTQKWLMPHLLNAHRWYLNVGLLIEKRKLIHTILPQRFLLKLLMWLCIVVSYLMGK